MALGPSAGSTLDALFTPLAQFIASLERAHADCVLEVAAERRRQEREAQRAAVAASDANGRNSTSLSDLHGAGGGDDDVFSDMKTEIQRRRQLRRASEGGASTGPSRPPPDSAGKSRDAIARQQRWLAQAVVDIEEQDSSPDKHAPDGRNASPASKGLKDAQAPGTVSASGRYKRGPSGRWESNAANGTASSKSLGSIDGTPRTSAGWKPRSGRFQRTTSDSAAPRCAS